ncbi:TPA_asm: hypothetical protein GYP86_00440 [Listeria monocytogenes]|nr:hypothetical protein [Listeria monocytogenes]HAB7656777.1 hypothetical protein [Listeria monocytogenes]HAB7874278.1 hypothetical protein [Listeria monocytogenes]HAB7883861.1 hypothetical protein [Listeria monocytogenes]HAC0409860.1 hypothetical protein [Listeria monocytogenes]
MYEFQGLDAAEESGLPSTRGISERIEFGNFNSRDEGLYLITRDAPTPAEKEVIDDVPFMQGVYDFSSMLGERVFQNRLISYEFQLFNVPYRERKIAEIKLKQKLMGLGNSALRDSHDTGFYWLGKCSSVVIEDDETYKNLKAVITFDCYPFMISEKQEWDDVWDTVNFNLDIFQKTFYKVEDSTDVVLFNTGSVSATLKVTASKPLLIKKGNKEYSFNAGTTQDDSFRIDVGKSVLSVRGFGTVKFEFVKEVLG